MELVCVKCDKGLVDPLELFTRYNDKILHHFCFLNNIKEYNDFRPEGFLSLQWIVNRIRMNNGMDQR